MAIFNTVYGGEGGWKPGANTVAYFPFTEDKSDLISGGPSLSSSTATIATVGGVTCLSCPGTQQQTLDIGFTSSVGSGMFWIYLISNSGVITFIGRQVISGSTYHDRQIVMYSGNLLYSREGYNTNGNINTTEISTNQWHCIGFSDGTSGGELFIDGVSVGTSSVAPDYSALTGGIGVGCNYKNTGYERAITGGISKLVLNSTTLSLSDFQYFYNKTKSDYGLI